MILGMTNLELAQKLKDLRDFLIIAGYDESHAVRYTHLARTIEKLPENLADAALATGKITLPGVGPLIERYILEIIRDGVSSKQLEWEEQAPISVLELVRIESIGPKTARRLYSEFGISSLATLKVALDEGRLENVSGIGPKTLRCLREAAEG